ncbi:WPP domain-associated protein-like [Lycium barbarum]|uniref:WPP domain-associated protein-like n=1 Tax=Lycium barbarum TaxID=112863 RepID=UPI00293ED43F|nr:WPP domain-associated protein-like [Lycium barbarum]
MGDELESMNFRKHMTVSDVFMEHGKMGDFLDRLRSLAKDEFKKLKKSIDEFRGSKSMRNMSSRSEMVGLEGILQEKESGIWVQLDKTVNNLKMMLDTVFKRMDDMLQLSKTSLGQWQQEHLTQVEIEAMVMRSVIRTVQEDFEYKLWDQYAKLCGERNEKLNDISNLRTELDAVLKSLSSSETGYMTSHGSHDADVFTRKTSSEHVTSSTWDGNEKMEDSKTDITENFDDATLKHMSKEEMVTYFNNIMTMMKRHHESILQKRTNEYFHLRADYLKLRGGSAVPHKKDKGDESDILRKKIPEIIFKLDDILVENEKHPAFTQETLSFGNLKDRLDSLLSENHQLRNLLKHKQVEDKSLLSQVSDANEKRLDSLLSENHQLRNLLKDAQVEVKSPLSQVSDTNEKRLDSLLSENHQLIDLLEDTQVEVKSLLSQVSDADEKRLDSFLSENHQLRDLLKDTQVEVKSLLSQVSDADEKRLDSLISENRQLRDLLKDTQVEVKSLLFQVDSLISENRQLRDLLKDTQVEVKSLLSQVSYADEKRLDCLISENRQLRDLLKDTQVEVKSLLSQVSDADEKRLDSLISENHQLRDLLKDTQVEVKSLLSQVSDADEKRLDSLLSENHQLRDSLKDTQVEVKSLLSQVLDADEKRLDSLISENRQLRDLLKDTQVEVKSLLSQVSDADEKRLDSLISENRQLRDLLKDTQVEVKSLLSQVSDADEKRLDSLLSENHQLRDSLKDTQVEVKSLLFQVSDANEKRLQYSLVEADMLKQIGDLNLAMEDSLIEASVREEVYTCFLRDLSGGTRNEAEELNLGFELLNDSNDTDAESTKFEIEDLEIECLILQEICGVISGEGIKEAKDMLKELYSEYLNEKDIRISLDTKVIEMENKLKFEVEEKDRLKQLVSELEICVTEKENLATEGSAALAKKMGQFEQVLQELNAVKEFASQQQTLASGCNKEVNVVKGQLAEALAQIEVLKEEAAQLNKSLEEKEEELKEANDSEEKKGFSPKKKKKQICNLGSCNKLFKKNAEGK